MALPPFADPDDLGPRLPAGVVVDDERAEAAIEDVSALIHAESDEMWVEDGLLVASVPPVIKTVCCMAAIRALVNPGQVTQESAGPYSATLGDVYLTTREREMIRRAAGGTSGLWTLATTRVDPVSDLADIYLDVVGSEQIPHVPVGEVNW